MVTTQTRVAQATSVALRICSYLFLRMALVPFLPPIIFTLLAINIPAFLSSYLTEPVVEIIDEVDVVVKETLEDEPSQEPNGNTEPTVVDEVDIQESVVIELKPMRPWKTLLYGAPNPRSLLLTVATLLINFACVGMVADRLFTEHQYTATDLSFARIGYVSDIEANVLIRESDQTKMPVRVDIRLHNPVPPFEDPSWQTVASVRYTTNETDYTAVVAVPLKNSKQRIYEWRTSNNHSGLVTAAPRAGQAATLFDGRFTFLTTSCIVSRLPYNPLEHPLAIPGMRYLAKLIPSLEANFMLFLGDWIYVDTPRRWGKQVEDYRQKYRQVYASPDWAAVSKNLSWIHVLDDHEIANDWSANTTGVYEAAAEPWQHYHVAANPPKAKRARTAMARAGATYFHFTQGPASFFLMDTRKYRSSNSLPANDEGKTMLGAEQLEDLLDYLRRPEPRGVKWKIVASSVPFTKNWRVNTRDTWGGFLVERKKILETMWDAGVRGYGVVVLSGDRHEFAATKFPPPANSSWPESAAVHEFSVSPLSQFYSPIPSYFQVDGEDVAIKYINTGNSKFGAITIEALEDGLQSSLKYRLFVDGVNTWTTVVLSPDPSSGSAARGGSFWDRLKVLNSGR